MSILGEKNNLISVKQSDFEVFQALAKDQESSKDDGQKEFSQEIPIHKPWEKNSGPPILPPHLLQVILNKDTPLSVSFPLMHHKLLHCNFIFSVNLPYYLSQTM